MNRLTDETSPYLRQHRDNPVDWYAWGDDAFARAREEDKPVLLSIGYSACHWCHVMAHESFEDPGTARLMNERFVNVKVDREERPDVDAIYMQAVQAMTGHGGWPLTVFLTPDGKPFFGGTYFPKESRHGLPGFVQVLEAIGEAWGARRGDLDAQADRLTQGIERTGRLRPSHEMLTTEILRTAYTSARSQFDSQFGGFGRAPKFPQAMTLELLLRAHVRNRADDTLGPVRVTLDHMAAGGIYDHVGGGFHRYSVDERWLVPHFEKMLYDQALLARVYVHAWQVTGDPAYRRVVEETVGYVLRDLRHDRGGFFSAQDADSEGVEGKYYVWGHDEIREVCGADAPEVIDYFGVTDGGNFEGANILHVIGPGSPRPEAVERALPRLFAARRRRVRPGLDDKVLLEWNALFLRTLAEAAAVLGRHDWLEAARANAGFLLTELRRHDGRLLRSWHPTAGPSDHLAYAADYGALLEALVTMAEADGVSWLQAARDVADGLIDGFGDPDAGGFFTTGRDAPRLVARVKDLFDNATPSENSLAAVGLIRLGALTGEQHYEEPAIGVLRLVRDALTQNPTAFSHLLEALERYLTDPLEVAVVGDPGAPDTEALWRAAWARLLPNTVRMRAAPAEGGGLTPLLEGRSLVDGRATAYVCERFACRQPVTSAADLDHQLDQRFSSHSRAADAHE